MIALWKKELRSYFTGVIGWLFIALFLVLTGLYFMIYNLGGGYTNFSYVYEGVQLFFVLLLVPVLTMRVLSEENRQKTDQLLYTAPVSIGKIILGKYLALLSVFAVAMVIVSLYPIILNNLVKSVATGGESVDFAIAYGSSLGFFLLGAAYIAIGMFISSLTESQVVAAVASGGIMIFTYLMGGLATWLPSGHVVVFWFLAVLIAALAVGAYFWIHNGWMAALVGILAEAALVVCYLLFTEKFDGLIGDVLDGISITSRYSNFTLGIFDVSALVYYLSVCFLFVFITIQRIKKKRYN